MGQNLNRHSFGLRATYPNIDVLPVQGINVFDILRRRKLVLTKAALEALELRFADAKMPKAAAAQSSEANA